MRQKRPLKPLRDLLFRAVGVAYLRGAVRYPEMQAMMEFLRSKRRLPDTSALAERMQRHLKREHARSDERSGVDRRRTAQRQRRTRSRALSTSAHS